MPEPGGPGGPLALPIFGRSVNPIQTGKGRLSPPITTGPLNVFHRPASLLNSCQYHLINHLAVHQVFSRIFWQSTETFNVFQQNKTGKAETRNWSISGSDYRKEKSGSGTTKEYFQLFYQKVSHLYYFQGFFYLDYRELNKIVRYVPQKCF